MSVFPSSVAEGSSYALIVWKLKNAGVWKVASRPRRAEVRSTIYHLAGSSGSIGAMASRTLRW